MTTATRKTAAAAAAPFAAFGVANKDAIDSFVKASTDAAQKGFEQAFQLTKENVEKASTNMFKSYGDMSGFGKENVEAVVRASSIYAKGMEDLSKALMTVTQAHFESTVAAVKAVMGCTTLRQVVDLQTDLAKTSFDKFVADGGKLSELSMKVANEALEPIQARVTVAVEKFVKPVAA